MDAVIAVRFAVYDTVDYKYYFGMQFHKHSAKSADDIIRTTDFMNLKSGMVVTAEIWVKFHPTMSQVFLFTEDDNSSIFKMLHVN